MKARPRSALGRWLAAWLGGAGIGVANGVLRERTYGRRVHPAVAHQVSTATAIAAFGAYFCVLQRIWPIPSEREAHQIGAVWLALTISFEFGFGHLVARQSWDELLADYNLAEGRTWPLVLVWLAAGPAVTRRLVGQAERDELAEGGPGCRRGERESLS